MDRIGAPRVVRFAPRLLADGIEAAPGSAKTGDGIVRGFS
jgi:hypothetical protein